ncbi:MAG: hypothetical protein P4L58_04510 [Candidatus Pacebacteria bacterium]|nr:hypothetical protein [Candidatus Paceibacterota bacterium]
MKRREAVQRGVAFFIVAIAFSFLAWNAATLGIENWDGMEYLASGLGLFGAPWGVTHPRNIQQVFLMGTIFRVVKAFGFKAGLPFFHLFYFSLHAALPFVVAGFLRRNISALPFLALVCVGACSRVFVHYSPFLMPDLSCALWVALWFYIEIKVPESSGRKAWSQIAVLLAIALNRPHAVIIPLVAMAWEFVADPSRLRRYVLISFVALGLYVAVFSEFFFLVYREISWLSVFKGISYFRTVVQTVGAVPDHPPFVYFLFLQKNLTWAGSALLVGGLWIFVKKRSSLPRPLQGLLFGSLAYFFLLLWIGEKQARYLAPLLSAWVMLQCLALAFLEEKRRWAGFVCILILFESVVPEFLHFLDPVYRSNYFEATAMNIAAWSESKYSIVLPYQAAFHPKDVDFHWNDNFFYLYHWGGHNLNFFAGMPTIEKGMDTFLKHGYPIPDHLQQIAPQGVTVVLPSPEAITSANAINSIYPIYAVRWFSINGENSRNCVPEVKDVCVEILTAFPGLTFEPTGT